MYVEIDLDVSNPIPNVKPESNEEREELKRGIAMVCQNCGAAFWFRSNTHLVQSTRTREGIQVNQPVSVRSPDCIACGSKDPLWYTIPPGEEPERLEIVLVSDDYNKIKSLETKH